VFFFVKFQMRENSLCKEYFSESVMKFCPISNDGREEHRGYRKIECLNSGQSVLAEILLRDIQFTHVQCSEVQL
jgi:hypothetical protein